MLFVLPSFIILLDYLSSDQRLLMLEVFLWILWKSMDSFSSCVPDCLSVPYNTDSVYGYL